MKVAMILAAGRGERLKPITCFIPKALCLVQGKPLIEHHIINLAKAGFDPIIINHAYLGAQLRHYLGNGRKWGVRLIYSPEPPGGLETGGGIFNALALLGNAPFLVVNADNYTSYDFNHIHLPKDSLAHMVLGPKPEYYSHYDYGLLGQKLTNNERKYTNLGIVYYHPQAFSHAQPGRYSVTPLIRQLADAHCVSAELFDGQWIDVGTLERLKAVM